MPGFNQKGPMGQGFMTGRKMGKCNGLGRNSQALPNNAEESNVNQPQNTEVGLNRGQGMCGGRRRGQGCQSGQGRQGGQGRQNGQGGQGGQGRQNGRGGQGGQGFGRNS